MPQALDLTGQRFGRLTVLWLAPKDRWPVLAGTVCRSWEVLCDCGKVRDRPVPAKLLNLGTVRSCGCLADCAGKVCPECGRTYRGHVNRVYCSYECKMKPCYRMRADKQRKWQRACHQMRLLAGLAAIEGVR